jgi:NADH-quinone oxidoreductase subunit G
MLIIGAGALARSDGNALLAAARDLADKFNLIRDGWNGFNVLQHVASRVGGLDLGFLPQANGFGTNGILSNNAQIKMDMVWLLGADEIDMTRLNGAFVIYQGHHGDAGAHRADVILPGAAYTEKSALYVNTEGRPQMALQAAFPPGEAREDWKIIRAFSEVIGRPLPFDTVDQLRAKMFVAAPVLANIGRTQPADWKPFGKQGALSAQPFAPVIKNFYMTDPISRASVTMAKCVEQVWPQIKEAAR